MSVYGDIEAEMGGRESETREGMLNYGYSMGEGKMVGWLSVPPS